MKYSVEKAEKYTIIKLHEEKLDTLKAPSLKSEFITHYQAGLLNLILDLSDVKYVDSSGLSALLVAHRMSNEVNGRFVLTGINEHVAKLLSISKLDDVFDILPTVQEGIDFVFLNEIEKDLNAEDPEA